MEGQAVMNGAGSAASIDQNKEIIPAARAGEKIYCANCMNCKLIRMGEGEDGKYVLRVRCAAGKWKKKLGEEKFYKYFTVARRSMVECDSYQPMGDSRTYIRELRKTLPIKDEVYLL